MSSAWLEAWFASFASKLSKWAGSPLAFSAALISILAWAVSGPYFGYSPLWQMIVNTGATICTFLMVFIVQNSQNRDGLAVQIKLEEIIRAIHGAKNGLINLESLSQQEMEQLQVKFAEIGSNARDNPLDDAVSSSDGINAGTPEARVVAENLRGLARS